MRFIATIFFLFVSCFVFAQADLSQTKYVAVSIQWEPNPANENVEWYIIEYNDEGLSDQTWSLLRNSAADVTEVYVPFTELVEKATRANGKPPVELTDELCVRIIAAKSAERSPQSEPACFTMLHDTREAPQPNEPPAVLSAPRNARVQHR